MWEPHVPIPLCPRCLLEGSRAAPKALGPVLEPLGEDKSLWERSLTPSSAPSSCTMAGTHQLSPWELLRAHREPFLLAKHEAPRPSVRRE